MYLVPVEMEQTWFILLGLDLFEPCVSSGRGEKREEREKREEVRGKVAVVWRYGRLKSSFRKDSVLSGMYGAVVLSLTLLPAAGFP